MLCEWASKVCWERGVILTKWQIGCPQLTSTHVTSNNLLAIHEVGALGRLQNPSDAQDPRELLWGGMSVSQWKACWMWSQLQTLGFPSFVDTALASLGHGPATSSNCQRPGRKSTHPCPGKKLADTGSNCDSESALWQLQAPPDHGP